MKRELTAPPVSPVGWHFVRGPISAGQLVAAGCVFTSRTWFDARAQAARHFGCTHADVVLVGGPHDGEGGS